MEVESKNGNKKYKIVGLIVGIIIIIGGIGLNYFTKKYLYNGKIAPNISIQEIDVSNKTKKEALEAVKSKYSEQALNLKYKDKDFEIAKNYIELKYDTEELVEKAYNFTRTGSYFKDVSSYIKSKTQGQKYTIDVSYDENKIDEILNKIAKQIDQKPVSATVRASGGISYTPSKTGLEFQTKENKKLVTIALDNKYYDTIDLQVKVTKPKITTEDVKSIDTALGSFSTYYSSSPSRAYNVALAAQRCNGTILLPGEKFSYNEHTGPRVYSNGFRNAPVIVGSRYTDAPGGGVCQTSTTVFNAALLSGLQIDKVRNHSKTSHYISRGRDAMVNDGDSDLVFTNNFDHAVYVQAYGSGGGATVTIYGSSKDKVGVSISVDHFRYNGRPAAKTYRTITKNGKSKTSYIYTSVYRE